MYSQIASNKRKTVYIMSLFLLIIGAIGYTYGLIIGDFSSLYFIFGFALIYSLISYYAASKVALKVNGAKQITKADSPEYYRIVENLAIATGLPMPKVYIMEDSSANAFATGRDPQHASVAVTTGLLEIMDKKELEAVMAHEMGHIQNYDIRVMMIVFACVSVIGLISDFLLRMIIWGGDDDDTSPLAVALSLILVILAPIVAMMVQLAVSRRREFLADATSAMTTRYPEGLISALKKLQGGSSVTKKQNSSTAHLFFANPLKSKNFSKLFLTHPPIEDRIAKLQKAGGGL